MSNQGTPEVSSNHLPRTRRMSFVISLSLVAAGVFWISVVGAPTASATAYTQSASATSWTTPTSWSPTGVPGSAPGDTASICGGMTIDGVVPNSVVVSSGCLPTLTVPSVGSLTIEPSSTFSSGGNVNITGGTFTINSGTPNPYAPFGFNVTMSSGMLQLLDNFAPGSGSVTISGGTIKGPGTFTLPGGTANFNGTSLITIDGATIINSGGVPSGISYSNSAGLAINNNGHISMVVGSPSGGVLNINGTPGPITRNDTLSSIDLSGGPAPVGGQLTCSAPSCQVGVPVNDSGSISFPATGAMTLSAGGTLGSLAINSGTMSTGATGALTLGGPWTFHGGSISGTGPVTFGTGAVVNVLSDSAAVSISSPNLTNNGTINMQLPSAASVDISGVTLTNSGTVNFQTDCSFATSVAGATINNNSGGLFEKTGSGATSSISATFTNAGGTVLAGKGTLSFSGSFTQSSGTTTLNGGSIAAGTLTLNGGTLNGAGTINGGVANNAGATVSPGLGSTPGMLSLTGPYTQAGALIMKVGGVNPGTDFDVLSTTSSASLGGSLTITNAPLGVVNGQGYNIVTGAIGGLFGTITYPAPAASWTTNYSPTAVQVISSQADLQITKTAVSPTISNGTNAQFTITVANLTPTGGATNVSVTDSFTGSASVVSATGTGWSCVVSTSIICSLSSLAGGATSAPITITLSPTAPGTIANTATVSSPTFDPNSTNNTASASVTVNPSADLGLTITGPASVNAGANATFTATITNAGPDAAAAYTATFTISGGTVVSATGAGGITCTAATPTFTCTGSSLASAGTATVTIVATAGTGTSMTLGGSVSPTAPTTDPNSANNTVSPGPSVVINPSADIQTTQAASPTSIAVGQNSTFTINVTNNGPSNATSVSVTDTFTNGTLVSVSSTPGTSCSGTTSITCSIATLASGATETITLTLTPVASGTMTNSTTASSAAFDANSTNNTSSANVTVSLSADVAIYSSSASPNPVTSGQNTTITEVVKNFGPSPATNVTFTDTFSTGTFVSATSTQGSCSGTGPVTCSIGSLSAGSMVTITIVLTAGTTSINNTASVTATEPDPNTANNSAPLTISTSTQADVTVFKSGPSTASIGDTVTYSIIVRNNGPAPATSIRLTDPTPADLTLVSVTGACSAFPCTIASLSDGQNAYVTAKYTVNGLSSATSIVNTATVTAANDSTPNNNTASATTVVGCTSQPPTPLSPVGIGIVTSPITFAWTSVPTATVYEVFVTQNGSTNSLGKTSDTHLIGNVSTGQFTWYVVATTSDCGPLTSASTIMNACNTPGVPQTSVVANAASGQTYSVQWPNVPDAGSYEIQEATNEGFGNPTTQTVTTNSVSFTKTAATSAQPFFYRVRAISSCDSTKFSNYSPVVRIVIAPISAQNRNINVPAGSTTVVVQTVHIPGFTDGNSYSFVASVDQPWMTVSPSSGILPAAGIDLQVSADPSSLPNGTFTATVIVAITPATASNARTNGTTTVSVPVSISLVTPVTPTNPTTTAANAYIIPSVGHLDGINSQWQSDVRLANAGFSKQQFVMTFTPTGSGSGIATSGVKQTTVTVDAGATMALDDIAHNWFGVGSLGEAANGVLMIRPLTSAGATTTPSVSSVVASSRTYSVSSAGTLGQYIPAIPFSAFVGAAATNSLPTVLSLQQIAQSAAYRTNVGLVEAAGQSANVTLSVFDDTGKDIKDIPLTVNPFQQVQLNSFLASQGISLNDGRVQVQVTGGSGKVTAYASVVDMTTNDPLLVSGVPLGQVLASRYVLPGVADLSNGQANWRSDVRIFNSGAAPESATLTLYPLGGGTPLTSSTTLNPGEVKLLDNAVQTLFNTTNLGGALHITTASASNLIVTGRTYNAVSGGGTYGQFIPAVTSADAVGVGSRSLQILQVEDSPRYRTNLGVAEVTGQAATVQIQVYLPDSKVIPTVTFTMNPYEYRQLPVIQSMGLGNVYNARISVNVTGGNGKIAAYGSVIDQQTQDPTYVPAQ